MKSSKASRIDFHRTTVTNLVQHILVPWAAARKILATTLLSLLWLLEWMASGTALNRVGSRFVRVRPGLKMIRVWPRLDHVSRKFKKARYGSTMTAATATFASWATPTFWNHDFACCKCTGSPTLHFFRAYACYNCHLQLAQNHAHYCCRSSTTAVLIACMKPLPPRFGVYKLTGSHNLVSRSQTAFLLFYLFIYLLLYGKGQRSASNLCLQPNTQNVQLY